MPHENLTLDHVFICTAAGAPEAQALIDAGLLEGSPNTHLSQGTTNRRFFFEHGFLELLWVHDEREARSPLTAPTRLWERWSQRDGTANPFGLCFAPTTTETSRAPVPFETWPYQPRYLPQDKHIAFAQGTSLTEPELFALSWPPSPRPPSMPSQPTAHRLPLRALRAVSVGLAPVEPWSTPIKAAQQTGLISVHCAPAPELVLSFSAPTPIHLHIPALSITLVGQPDRHPPGSTVVTPQVSTG